MRAVVFVHRIVDGIFREFRVQFARVSVFVLPVEVVDAVGDVGCFLDFSNERPRSDAVDASGRKENTSPA